MTTAEIQKLLKRIPLKMLHAEVGRRNSMMRGTHAGGRPKTVKLCPGCKEPMGVREYRAHECLKGKR